MTLYVKSSAREQHLFDTDCIYKILIGFPWEESSLIRYSLIITKLEFNSILIFCYAVILITRVYSCFTLWPLIFSIQVRLKEKVGCLLLLDLPFLEIFNILLHFVQQGPVCQALF